MLLLVWVVILCELCLLGVRWTDRETLGCHKSNDNAAAIDLLQFAVIDYITTART